MQQHLRSTSASDELQVNPVREKKLTNVRNTGSEEKVSLSPPRIFTLEDAIGRFLGIFGYKGSCYDA